MHFPRKRVFGRRPRPEAVLATAFVLLVNHPTLVLAAAPWAAAQLPCDSAMACTQTTEAPASQITVPQGLTQCPESGAGAACAGDAPAGTTTGDPSVPTSETQCPDIASKPLLATPAACSDALLHSDGKIVSDNSTGPITPSVPVASLGPRWATQKLDLNVSSSSMRVGDKAVLTATSSISVTSTDTAIEIFDQTSWTLIGACAQRSQCVVAYSSLAGTHAFRAFITQPTTRMPVAGDVPVASNTVKVSWLGVTLSSDSAAVGPGHLITFTARSTIDVANSGHVLQIYDDTAKKLLTYCTHGTSCSTSYQLTNSASHSMFANLSGTPDARSNALNATWLSVTLRASTGAPQTGETRVKATVNTDLSRTPWSVAIYDAHGAQIALCKTGLICTGRSNSAYAPYMAAIGSVAPPNIAGRLSALIGVAPTTALTNIQAKSGAVEPAHVIWGVDSCKAINADVGREHNLYANTSGHVGAPDFWGRYLTDTVCSGFSAAEASVAHSLGLGILPIYNDYNCSAVVGYDTGSSYGHEATNAAANLGIPAGRAIAIDIEPPGDACPGAANVEAGFVQGWYDAVTAAHYTPVYYGNGTAGSEFAAAWCAAVSPDGGRPEIAAASYLWSFEPSLMTAGGKGNAPGFAPNVADCSGDTVAWQYAIDTGPTQDLDLDEALTSLPLWFP